MASNSENWPHQECGKFRLINFGSHRNGSNVQSFECEHSPCSFSGKKGSLRFKNESRNRYHNTL